MVKPGDTITLLPGTYRGGFKCTLSGTESAPITIRGARGAFPTIDCRPRVARDSGLFTVQGAWVVVRDLEFTCSDEKRSTSEKGSWPAEIRRGGIDAHGAHLKFINLLVHDLANGFGFWGKDASEEGGEIYGCLIYYNGWRGPDRGHGHAIYSQNAAGTKRIVDNMVFAQFGTGIHVYGSKKAALRGYHIEGNICFNNGALTGAGQRGTDLLVGGETPLENVTVSRNYTYGGGGVRFGYVWGPPNQAIDVRDNYIAGAVSASYLVRPTFTHNTIVAPGTLASLDLPAGGLAPDHGWNHNTWLRTKTEFAAFNITEEKRGRGLTFADWQAKLGLDRASTYAEKAPTGTKVFVRPNQYEKGRGHIAVYNWDRAAHVEVDLSAILSPGQNYRIASARNFRGAPIISGAYTGRPVMLPMAPVAPALPVGLPEAPLPVDAPQFEAFVVLPN